MASKPITRLGGLDLRDIDSLLDRLDLMVPKQQRDDRRRHPRYPYRIGPTVLRVTQGDFVSESVCVPRNLSVAGLSALYRGFLHQGVRIETVLRLVEGDPIALAGHVRSCRHVHGMLHEIGVQFEERIDPSWFCDPRVLREARRASRRSHPLPRLCARGIYVSNDERLRTTLAQLLRTTGMEVEEAPFLGRAIDQLKSSTYDVVLCDSDLEEIRTESIVNALRSAGFPGLVVVLTPRMNAQSIAAIAPDDRTEIVGKPPEMHDLCEVLRVRLDAPSPTMAGTPTTAQERGFADAKHDVDEPLRDAA